METIDSDRFRRAIFIAAGVLMIAGIASVLRHWMSTPQIGPDEEVFKTVDALFTAINSRDQQRLKDCEQTLNEYRDDGRLPAATATFLDSVIKQADAGNWRASARILYDFMLAQRRV